MARTLKKCKATFELHTNETDATSPDNSSGLHNSDDLTNSTKHFGKPEQGNWCTVQTLIMRMRGWHIPSVISYCLRPCQTKQFKGTQFQVFSQKAIHTTVLWGGNYLNKINFRTSVPFEGSAIGCLQVVSKNVLI